jgi:hypothetical protein
MSFYTAFPGGSQPNAPHSGFHYDHINRSMHQQSVPQLPNSNDNVRLQQSIDKLYNAIIGLSNEMNLLLVNNKIFPKYAATISKGSVFAGSQSQSETDIVSDDLPSSPKIVIDSENEEEDADTFVPIAFAFSFALAISFTMIIFVVLALIPFTIGSLLLLVSFPTVSLMHACLILTMGYYYSLNMSNKKRAISNKSKQGNRSPKLSNSSQDHTATTSSSSSISILVFTVLDTLTHLILITHSVLDSFIFICRASKDSYNLFFHFLLIYLLSLLVAWKPQRQHHNSITYSLMSPSSPSTLSLPAPPTPSEPTATSRQPSVSLLRLTLGSFVLWLSLSYIFPSYSYTSPSYRLLSAAIYGIKLGIWGFASFYCVYYCWWKVYYASSVTQRDSARVSQLSQWSTVPVLQAPNPERHNLTIQKTSVSSVSVEEVEVQVEVVEESEASLMRKCSSTRLVTTTMTTTTEVKEEAVLLAVPEPVESKQESKSSQLEDVSSTSAAAPSNLSNVASSVSPLDVLFEDVVEVEEAAAGNEEVPRTSLETLVDSPVEAPLQSTPSTTRTLKDQQQSTPVVYGSVKLSDDELERDQEEGYDSEIEILSGYDNDESLSFTFETEHETSRVTDTTETEMENVTSQKQSTDDENILLVDRKRDSNPSVTSSLAWSKPPTSPPPPPPSPSLGSLIETKRFSTLNRGAVDLKLDAHPHEPPLIPPTAATQVSNKQLENVTQFVKVESLSRYIKETATTSTHSTHNSTSSYTSARNADAIEVTPLDNNTSSLNREPHITSSGQSAKPQRKRTSSLIMVSNTINTSKPLQAVTETENQTAAPTITSSASAPTKPIASLHRPPPAVQEMELYENQRWNVFQFSALHKAHKWSFVSDGRKAPRKEAVGVPDGFMWKGNWKAGEWEYGDKNWKNW